MNIEIQNPVPSYLTPSIITHLSHCEIQYTFSGFDFIKPFELISNGLFEKSVVSIDPDLSVVINAYINSGNL